MKKTCSWLLALAGVLSLAGTTQAGTLPLLPLYLPQLFGQETAPRHTAVQAAAVPQSTATPAHDGDWLGDCLADTLDLLMEYAPEARALVQSLRPCTPYHIAAAAILEYLAAVDAAEQGNDAAPAIQANPAQSPSSAVAPACKACQTQSCPSAGSCPLTSGSPAKVIYRITADGHVECVTVESHTATPYNKTSTCPVDLSYVADACDNGVICCQAVAQVGVAAKACKCCEDCKDCKDCSCPKSVVKNPVPSPGTVVIMQRCGDGPVCTAPIALPSMPPPPPYPPMAYGFPPPHPLMPPMPPSPFDELRELHMQRQMITSAIEQIELELAQMEAQRHVVLAPVAPRAQKVHLVTEHFEAHCESLHCVNGEPHRIVLEGDVRLTSKKCGHTVNIEAPCVVVNMKDGTFAVESGSPAAAQGVQPTPPVMLWTPTTDLLRGLQWTGQSMPVPVHYQPAVPAETLPMPCPICPARPVRPVGDK